MFHVHFISYYDIIIRNFVTEKMDQSILFFLFSDLECFLLSSFCSLLFWLFFFVSVSLFLVLLFLFFLRFLKIFLLFCPPDIIGNCDSLRFRRLSWSRFFSNSSFLLVTFCREWSCSCFVFTLFFRFFVSVLYWICFLNLRILLFFFW